MPRGIFLVPKDLFFLEGRTRYKDQWKAYDILRSALGVKKISIQTYAAYTGAPVDEIVKALEPTGPKRKRE